MQIFISMLIFLFFQAKRLEEPCPALPPLWRIKLVSTPQLLFYPPILHFEFCRTRVVESLPQRNLKMKAKIPISISAIRVDMTLLSSLMFAYICVNVPWIGLHAYQNGYHLNTVTAVFMKVSTSILHLGHVTRSRIASKSCDNALGHVIDGVNRKNKQSIFWQENSASN